jgi:hypothetical protein
MVQHPVARVLQKFINLHRTQLQSYLLVEVKNKNKINKTEVAYGGG